jgi:uncharacterized hydrophobic protein (TIGR00271 family)
VVHLRILVPSEKAQRVVDLLSSDPAVINLAHLPGVALKPDGDLIHCDVAREEASVLVGDLRELEVDEYGSIAIEDIDSAISRAAVEAEKAAEGLPVDAVVWEEVETKTQENVELSASFLAFMVLSMLIAACGIYLDQVVLIIGAMVVGPEFGPLAALAVAIVQKRRDLAIRSLRPLVIGFPLGIAITLIVTLILDGAGLIPENLTFEEQPFTAFISHPDFFSFFVAYLAGTAGVLSLTAAKSGALVGVLISVTTIPAAANIGVAAALGDSAEALGATAQLSLNLFAITLAGIATLFVQRRLYLHRRVRHLEKTKIREAAGLPVGRSRRADSITFEPPDASS